MYIIDRFLSLLILPGFKLIYLYMPPSSLKNDLEDVRTSVIFYRQFTVIVRCHWKVRFIFAFVTRAIHLFTRQLVKTISVGKTNYICFLQTSLSDLIDFQG